MTPQNMKLVTTVATAYQKNPTVFRKVKQVVSMGGALDVPGNTSATAEFNFFADPYVPQSRVPPSVNFELDSYELFPLIRFAAEVVLKAATKKEFKAVILPVRSIPLPLIMAFVDAHYCLESSTFFLA